MAVKHNTFRSYGLQFHPESFLTHCGTRILTNFLNVPSAKSVAAKT